jgi:hypothetical protein
MDHYGDCHHRRIDPRVCEHGKSQAMAGFNSSLSSLDLRKLKALLMTFSV